MGRFETIEEEMEARYPIGGKPKANRTQDMLTNRGRTSTPPTYE